MKVGSVIVREYQGKLHEVLVVPGGFCWQGEVFASLSTIARKITGTSWNGPRFFGLRGGESAPAADAVVWLLPFDLWSFQGVRFNEDFCRGSERRGWTTPCTLIKRGGA